MKIPTSCTQLPIGCGLSTGPALNDVRLLNAHCHVTSGSLRVDILPISEWPSNKFSVVKNLAFRFFSTTTPPPPKRGVRPEKMSKGPVCYFMYGQL